MNRGFFAHPPRTDGRPKRVASGTTVVAQGKYSQLWVREPGGWGISREEWFRMK
jgi:hypothetical protein